MAVESKQSSCFSRWFTPEQNTYAELSLRTAEARIRYDRDERQIESIFQKKRKSGQVTDCTEILKSMKETSAFLTAIITDTEEKLQKFRQLYVLALYSLDERVAPIYSYLKSIGYITGTGGVATGLYYGQQNTNALTNCDTPPPQGLAQSAPTPAGWLGLAVFLAVCGLTEIKVRVQALQKAQADFSKIFDDNARMLRSHTTATTVLNTIQADYDHENPDAMDDLAQKISDCLSENYPEADSIPVCLRKAREPKAIRRAILLRAPSLDGLGSPRHDQALPANTPSTEVPLGSPRNEDSLSRSVAFHLEIDDQ